MHAGPDRVQGVLIHQNGETRREDHVLAFERLAPDPPDNPFAHILTPEGKVPLCPVAVSRDMHDRAWIARVSTMAQCQDVTHACLDA